MREEYRNTICSKSIQNIVTTDDETVVGYKVHMYIERGLTYSES